MSVITPIHVELDPGIARTVKWLRKHGFNTTDSGDGVSKPEEARVMDGPHVFMVAPPEKLIEETDRLYSLVINSVTPKNPVNGIHVEASYSPSDPDIGIIALIGVDDQLLFVGKED